METPLLQPPSTGVGDQSMKLWGPMKGYTSIIYDYPWIFLILVPLITIGLTLVLLLYQKVTLSADINNYRWEGDEITQRWDAYVGAAQQTFNSLFGLLGQSIPMPHGLQMGQQGAIAYQRLGKNILDPESLREIWKTEVQMHATPGWGDYCFRLPVNELPGPLHTIAENFIKTLYMTIAVLEPDTNCIGFKTMLMEYQQWMTDTYQVQNFTEEDITKENFTLYLGSDFDRIVQTYLGNDFNETDNSTSYIRSIILFGFPIAGYKNIADRKDEQTQIIGEWQLQFLKPVDKLNKEKPFGLQAFNALSYSMNIQISNKALQQIWWLCGSFGFLFVFAVLVQRSFFTSILGVIGVFFPIPCAVTILQGVFGIHYLDIIYIIGLFLICGIGADCVFIIFELFRQSRSLYGDQPKLRLAYAGQRSLIALATSLATSGISFLSLLNSEVRVMKFFGVFCFLLLFITFCFTFTWYLSVLAVWSRYFEKSLEEFRLNQIFESEENFVQQDYPHQKLFDFLKSLPSFDVDAAGLPIKQFNKYEQFFYNKVAPFLYFYRLPIVIIAISISIAFGVLTFKMKTKNNFQFLKSDDPLQKAYDLCNSAYHSVLEDYDFNYIWGIEPTTKVAFKDKLTIDNYGQPNWAPFDFLDPEVQIHINKTWDLINAQDFIDPLMTQGFGCNPIGYWSTIFNMDKALEPWLWIIRPFINISSLPTDFPLNQAEYSSLAWLWMALLSELAFDSSDPYVRGTGKGGMIGFSNLDYSLKYIGMRATMKIPSHQTVEAKQDLYDKAMELERMIERNSPKGLKGFHCSQSWLKMVTELQMPKQIIIDIIIAFSCAAVVILVSTRKPTYTVLVIISMLCTLFTILGILYLTNWKIGTNEAIMISIASGFCSDFIIQPMLAMAYDSSRSSTFGKIQASLTTFAVPVSSALVTTLAAATFLYPCAILLYTPFATFLLGSGSIGFIYGFVVLPAMIALLESTSQTKHYQHLSTVNAY